MECGDVKYMIYNWYNKYFLLTFHHKGEVKLININGEILNKSLINYNFKDLESMHFPEIKFFNLDKAKNIAEKHYKNKIFW
jgi:hypothetical protein